jgi:hypothetical protein
MALAICTVLLSVVGCPWLVSATVPSLNHVKSLAYYTATARRKTMRTRRKSARRRKILRRSVDLHCPPNPPFLFPKLI